jgi:hypothetical protein
LKNDTVILHTPAEAVLKELLSHPLMAGRLDWSNWLSWATLAPWVAIALLAAVQYHHNRKPQALVFAAGLEASSRLIENLRLLVENYARPDRPTVTHGVAGRGSQHPQIRLLPDNDCRATHSGGVCTCAGRHAGPCSSEISVCKHGYDRPSSTAILSYAARSDDERSL